VQADGEIIGETPVEVTVVPRALRVVVPPDDQTPAQG
jgi:diacylglycerol kinase family enzyme